MPSPPTEMAKSMKIGIAESTNLTRTILPVEEIHLAFQPAIFLITCQVGLESQRASTAYQIEASQGKCRGS
uniref:Uncharacterized protein n=1 Tax=Triticum urartu TaxID=4572 RepID=A0A8R7V0L4_TRIUA